MNIHADQTIIGVGMDEAIDFDNVLVQSGTYNDSIVFSDKNIVAGSFFLNKCDVPYISNTVIDKQGIPARAALNYTDIIAISLLEESQEIWFALVK